MEKKSLYHVAVYLRLSRDDISTGNGNGTEIESNSIRSQRDLICSYIKKQEDMEIFDIYIDMKFNKMIQFEKQPGIVTSQSFIRCYENVSF